MGKSKRPARGVDLSLQALTSPVELLKSLGQYEDQGNENVAVELEKHAMESGYIAVYPTHPFKHGYKRIYPDKEQLKKDTIGVQTPLTNGQLQMIPAFLDSADVEQCNSDTQYLNLLKSQLTQKCNVQQPDELSWNEILSHITIFLKKRDKLPKEPMLSEKQLELWKLLEAKSLSAKEIGKLLGVSAESVRQHIMKIREKYGQNAIDNTASRGYWRPDNRPLDDTERV